MGQNVDLKTNSKEDVNKITALYNQGKWEEGRRLADQVLHQTPLDADMHMLLGKYYLQYRRYPEARFELAKSLEINPNNVDAKYLIISVETEAKRYSSAICYVNELLEINPYWKGLWRKKVNLYRAMGNQAEADRLLKRMSQIYPNESGIKEDQVEALNNRRSQLRMDGKLDESIAESKRIIELQPDNKVAYLNLIDDYLKAKDFNKALIYSDRAYRNFVDKLPFLQKKIAILEEQGNYTALLVLLEQQLKKNPSTQLRKQYDKFLIDAARYAKNEDPDMLYFKIFDKRPGDIEAFQHIYNQLLAEQNPEEALYCLLQHRRAVGASKVLEIKELELYKRMQNEGKVIQLTSQLFVKYPSDEDLKKEYLDLKYKIARGYMQEENYHMAIVEWKEILRFADAETAQSARHGLYNAYLNLNQIDSAIALLNEQGNVSSEILLKKAALFAKLKVYDQVLDCYRQISAMQMGILPVSHAESLFLLMNPYIKQLIEEYKFIESRHYLEEWIRLDPNQADAQLSLINVCGQTRDYDSMLRYAETATAKFEDNVNFKIKLAQAMSQQPLTIGRSWQLLLTTLYRFPYHKPLIDAFVGSSDVYSNLLIKEKSYTRGLQVIDSALHYAPGNKEFLYKKGLAYEGLKQFDSAYYYQKYAELAALEVSDFKQHIYLLRQRGYKNNLGITHFRARFGDDDAITSISSIMYHRRFEKYGLQFLVNYTGRVDGKGLQGQVDWAHYWSDKWTSNLTTAVSNQFFAKYVIVGTAFYNGVPSWEGEIGLGYRKFFTADQLAQFNLGLSKEINDFKVSAKLSNYLQNTENYLYNLMAKGQYFTAGTKNYVLAMASVGNAPDVDLINSQLYNSFNVLNTMVGAGLGRVLHKNIQASVIGNCYNFQSNNQVANGTYRNLYTLYFQLNVNF